MGNRQRQSPITRLQKEQSGTLPPQQLQSQDFDYLARAVAQGMSRREVFRSLAKGFLVTMLGSLGFEQAWLTQEADAQSRAAVCSIIAGKMCVRDRIKGYVLNKLVL